MAEPYLTAKIQARAIIGGAVFDDVISVSATFALNSIPTASVVVAVGKNVDQKIATIHKKRSTLNPRAHAEIFVKISNVTGEPMPAIAEGEYKVFEGYLAGIGYQRSHNHANYVINLVHWLDDLNNSSAINGNWFPGVPHDWAEQASFDTLGANAQVGAGTLVPNVTRGLANYENISSDLWKKVLKPMFERIGGFAGGAVQDKYGGGTIDKRNNAAKAALDRMPGDGPYVPLALTAVTADENFSNSVASFLTRATGASFVQNTVWSKLINEYAAQFLFAISPAVEWATPIPFCAGLRHGGDAKTITAKEYNYANFNANMSQLIEAVYVYHPAVSATNTPDRTTPNNLRLSFYKPWAYFPENPQKGLKLFKNVPAWLANLDPAALTALSAAIAVRDANAKRSGGAELPQGRDGKVELTAPAHVKQANVAKAFAKHWYYTEILQQRYGEMSGPLRFDIAPGSIIKIELPPRDADLARQAGASSVDEFMVASVISVSYLINAERAIAGTSFSIAHMKTKHEHEDELYSTLSPPLYNEPWFSGPLARQFDGVIGIPGGDGVLGNPGINPGQV